MWARKLLRESSGEDGQVELSELVEVGEERVVFVEAFAEAEAGVEDDLVAWDAGGGGGFEAFGEFGEDEGKDFVGCEGWECGPVLRAAAGVHEDGSAGEFGAGGGHGGVPEVAADVVDDLGSGFDGEAGGGGVEGVDGEDGLRGVASRMASMTGRMRDCSSSGVSGVALGRVDSPPMSRMSAPSSSMVRAWARARSGACSGE